MPVDMAGVAVPPPDEPDPPSPPPEPPLLLEEEPLWPFVPEELPEPAGPPEEEPPEDDPDDPVDTAPELDAVPLELPAVSPELVGVPLELPAASPELEAVPPELCPEPDDPSPVLAGLPGGLVDAPPEHAIGPMSVNNGSNERRCRLVAIIVLAFLMYGSARCLASPKSL